MIVGIDLGTTYSLVAWLSPNGPALIPNALGELLTPSVVGVDLDGEIRCGKSYAANPLGNSPSPIPTVQPHCLNG
jgi:molecular chaperone DnaK (HSP70)